MRVFAVLANLAQVGIVLAIFVHLGLSLGSRVVTGLFVLLIIALINQIVIFFYAVNKPVYHPLIGSGGPSKKREGKRVTYVTAPQPTVIINERPYSVLDLAENGMRFSIERRVSLKKHLSGRISLLSGQALFFQGTIVRRQNNATAIAFAKPVKPEVLSREEQLLEGSL